MQADFCFFAPNKKEISKKEKEFKKSCISPKKLVKNTSKILKKSV